MAVNYDAWLTSPSALEERYYGYADEEEQSDYDDYDARREQMLIDKYERESKK